MELKPKCVIIASFSNPTRVLEEVERIKRAYEVEVILPTKEWMDRMQRLMGSTSGHFEDKGKCVLKRIHMETYLRAIREADFVHVFNVKTKKLATGDKLASGAPETMDGGEVEYYGMNTLIEIGYAHCLGKLLTSYLEPTEPELRYLISMQI